MRTFVFKGILGLALLSGLGTVAAAAATPTPEPFPADQARTMEEVTDRVVKAEQQMNSDVRKYSPLVETYIQNLRPDTELGYVPAGDKYFLGKADFGKGVNLVSLSDTDSKGKKVSRRRRQFLFVRDAVFARRLLADDFYRHERIRQAALQV